MGRGGNTGGDANGANNSPDNETMRLAPQNRPMNAVAPASGAPSAAAGDRNGFLARLEAKQAADARSVKDLQQQNLDATGVNPHLNTNANAYSQKKGQKK